MDLTQATTTVPFKTTADGTVRVGGTRVTLDTLIGAFKDGATAEEIVYQFPVLDLGDVYAVIGYYLKNLKAIEQYLNRQTAESAHIRQKVEEQFSPKGLRQRLLQRRDRQKRAAS
ncbi:MAG: DUF433 domain-containing protein [Lewinellaceae bacterium]|nr:DUF433 domain-containing protein [Lewinellaceae bacterium]MCB9333291.1 DUF433 domain-containing protein [Lewinellaceae bacterium]